MTTKVIFVSNLFPNPQEPLRATYNKRLLTALGELPEIDVSVIAPIYWFPFFDSLIRRRKKVPSNSVTNRIPVSHPKVFYTPGMLIHHHWRFYQRNVSKVLKSLVKALSQEKESKVHVILGFAYPDAVAMAPVCEKLGLSYSVRINGSDFRVRIKQPKFRQMVLNCLNQASRIFCPGEQLKEDMVREGIDRDKIVAFNNGVEKEVFFFRELEARSKELGDEGISLTPRSKPKDPDDSSNLRSSILFVGNLVDVKAPERLLKSFGKFRQKEGHEYILNIIGSGPLQKSLEQLRDKLDLQDHVQFLGRQTPENIAKHMRNASCLCLCSKFEGMPNVVVEALSCGCPVIATSVGEVPHLVKEGFNGYTVEQNSSSEERIIADLASKLELMKTTSWNRKAIADTMSEYTWGSAASKILTAIQ